MEYEGKTMKIAATISNYYQVSQEDYRDIRITKVFSESATIHEIIEWAKTIDQSTTFHSISLSEVVE